MKQGSLVSPDALDFHLQFARTVTVVGVAGNQNSEQQCDVDLHHNDVAGPPTLPLPGIG
jgi:hypothetical protein